ncbi:uncharacterized protein [Rutidosis leptorrhynchoides]|uniref:uncharacterized protein n=1 Tax=Rutidosis leptorrhynchoides TaxID=125765 RepID=UPI003A9A1A19
MANFMVEFINPGPTTAVSETAPYAVTWELFTDGASSSDGAGAGLILTNPDGKEHTYALRFVFPISNNEAEYEALLSGLRIAEKMGVKALKVAVDSQLVANQLNETFEARDPEVDALSKLASLTFSHFAKDVWVEGVEQKSTDVVAVPVKEVNTWMNPIINYLKDGTLPIDSVAAQKIRMKAPMYVIRNNVVYKKSFLGPLLRCVGPQEAETVIREVEVTNRDIVSGIKARLGTNRKGWVDELPMVLWAFWTTPKGSNCEMPCSLVYRSETVIPSEIAVPTQHVMEFNEETNVIHLKDNLNLLEECRCIVAINEASNKQKIAKYYNRRVRERSFRPGDYVWRNNNASRVEDLGKLGPNWEGPYEVVDALGNGAYNLKTDGKFVPRTSHATNLKKFYV